MALEKPSMPSFSLSLAMRSAACILSKVALSMVSLLDVQLLGVGGVELARRRCLRWTASSSRSFGAMVRRSQPASSLISPVLRKLAPMTTVL